MRFKFNKSLVLKILIFILLFFSINTIFYISSYSNNANQSAQDVARSVYDAFQQTVSEGKTVQSSYVNPILHNVPLYTIDRSKSGNVQLLCPAEGEFLAITIQPQSSGDVTLHIMYDSDNNGKLDKMLSISDISGFCANGFFKCIKEGDTPRCRIYSFEFSGVTRTLTYYETDASKVGGCFCLSPSCGVQSTNWMSHVGYILSVAGGAIAQAFLAVDPSYAISYSTVESFTLRLYGQSKANCVTLGGSSQVAGLASLKDSPALLSSKSSDLYFQQRSNQDSLIYAVDKMARNPLLVDTSDLQKCSIKYKVLTKTFEELFSYRGDCAFLYQPPTYCGVNCIQVVTPIYQYPYTWSQIDIKFTLPYEYYKSLSKIEFTHCSRCHDLYFYLNGKQIFEFHGGGGEYWFTLDIPVTNLIPPTKKTAADQIIQVKVYTKTYLGGHHTCNVYRTTSVSGPSFRFIFNEPVALCVVVDEFYDNQCTAYENDPDCVLWEETQDGIPTVMNGIKTGVAPYQTCREFCNRNVCSIWEIERTYKCNKRKEDSLAAARKRLESVASSIAIDRGIGIASYKDMYLEGSLDSTSNLKFICRKDLNLNGIFESNEIVECVNSGSEYFCPLDLTRCSYRTASFTCPFPGTYDATRKQCVALSEKVEEERAPRCCEPVSYTLNPDGSVTMENSTCIFEYNTVRKRCETNGIFTDIFKCSLNNSTFTSLDLCKQNCVQGNSTGQCYLYNQTASCPEGTFPDFSNRICYKEAFCDNGLVYDRNRDVCVLSYLKCPTGYDLVNNICVSSPECPIGSKFDSFLNACVADLKCPISEKEVCRPYGGDYYCSSKCFSDYVVSGNWVARDQVVRFPPQDLPDECIPVCRVKVNPSVKEMQAKVELNPTPRVVYKYLPCESIGGQYICPYNPEEGEEVVSPCNCASHFPEAITAIQAMRLAGQDMICSSGVEKTF